MRIAIKFFQLISICAVLILSQHSLADDDDTMGVTWVILIQNSEYDSFDDLNGPAKDMELIKASLAKYQIDKIVHKENMTKKEMVKFFSSELNGLINTNKVKSLLIWFAGRGAVLRQISYWIPADAGQNEVSSYFSSRELKMAMSAFIGKLQHTLIINEACAMDSKFNEPAPDPMVIRRCTDGYGLGKRSAQSLSFSGYDKSLENSRFTAKIAEVLSSSSAECIPIEKVVVELTEEVFYQNRQIPKFGPILNFNDQKGTFFFMKKQ